MFVSPGTSTIYTIVVSMSAHSGDRRVGRGSLPVAAASAVWSGNDNNITGALTDTIASLAAGASMTCTLTARDLLRCGCRLDSEHQRRSPRPVSARLLDDLRGPTRTRGVRRPGADRRQPLSRTLGPLDENQPSGTSIDGSTAHNPDAGETLASPSAPNVGGGPFPFNGAVSISGGNAAALHGSPIDYEVRRRVRDLRPRRPTTARPSVLRFDKVLLITVDDVNDPPFARCRYRTRAPSGTRWRRSRSVAERPARRARRKRPDEQ